MDCQLTKGFILDCLPCTGSPDNLFIKPEDIIMEDGSIRVVNPEGWIYEDKEMKRPLAQLKNVEFNPKTP